MKALILRGKCAGKVCEVSQYANDWVTLNPNKDMSERDQKYVMRNPFSPTSLAFSAKDIEIIVRTKGIGMFNGLYKVVVYDMKKDYAFTFKRR